MQNKFERSISRVGKIYYFCLQRREFKLKTEKIVVKQVGEEFKVLEVSGFLMAEIYGITGLPTVKALLGGSLENGRIYLEMQEGSEEPANFIAKYNGENRFIYGPVVISKVRKSRDCINPDEPEVEISVVDGDDIIGLSDDEIQAIMDSISLYANRETGEQMEHFDIDAFRQKMGWVLEEVKGK